MRSTNPTPINEQALMRELEALSRTQTVMIYDAASMSALLSTAMVGMSHPNMPQHTRNLCARAIGAILDRIGATGLAPHFVKLLREQLASAGQSAQKGGRCDA